MNVMHKRIKMAGACAMLLAAMATGGCGASGNTAGENGDTAGEKAETKAEQAPFTMTIYNNAGIADAYYQEYIEKHLKSKFPQGTFQYMKRSQGNDIQDLVAAGTVPDLILFGVDRILTYRDLGVLADLTPLIKQMSVDTSRFADGILDTIKSYSEHGELYAMPWSYNPAALYFNKDIFDKFGVPYPKDGMTWDELGDLVKKLSRTEGGVAIRGLDTARKYLLDNNQLSLPFVDAKTGKAAVNTEAWKKWFAAMSDFYSIPGNGLPANTRDETDAFLLDQTLAMRIGNNIFSRVIEMQQKGQSLNWDLVSMPTFKEAPGMGTQYNGATFAISATSKVKEQAMQAISVLVSDEVQLEGAKLARYPTLKKPDIQAALGQGEKVFEGKNIKSLQKNKVAATPKVTEYDTAAKTIVLNKLNEVVKGTKDINTALREADEEINKKIAEEQAKRK
ncbi:ABC transporter substrate-binding protein [Paenibacillus sp. HJGM_3]|uniref:ABC transporter substrate-binding protein n=1 Tax=Paenibacillus sp. HJGM_3 TaxID=3379816 RepID=UPI0038595898